MKIDTLCVQGGYRPECGQPRQVPIVSSTTFKYDTTQHMADLFDLKAPGYFYTRLANPTNDMVAKKIAALEGGVAAILTSSGQAASTFAILNLCNAGDHVVSSAQIYGGTFNLFAAPLRRTTIATFSQGPKHTPPHSFGHVRVTHRLMSFCQSRSAVARFAVKMAGRLSTSGESTTTHQILV